MAKYTANIVAKVEMGQLDKLKSQIEALEKNEINLKFSANGLNLNNLVNQINSQLGKAGTSAGNNLGNNIASSVQKATAKVKSVTATNLTQLKEQFKNFNIDTSIVDNFEKSLKAAKITVNDLSASIKNNGKNSTVSLTVSGVDELGNAVKAVQSFNNSAKKGLIKSSELQINQSDVSGVKAQAEAATKAYEKLKIAAKECADAQVSLTKSGLNFGEDSIDYKNKEQKLKNLTTTYENLKSQFSSGGIVSDSQINDLDKLASAQQRVMDVMTEYASKSTKAAQKKAETEAYKELTAAAKEYAQAQVNLLKAETNPDYTSDTTHIQNLKKVANDAKKAYDDLKVANKDLVSDSQIAELDKLANAEQRVLDITSKFSTDSDVSAKKEADAAKVKAQAEAYKELEAAAKQCARAKIDLEQEGANHGTDTEYYKKLSSDLDTATKKFENLKVANKDLVSQSQISDLNELASAEKEVLGITAQFVDKSNLAAQKKADAEATEQQVQAYNRLKAIIAEIGKYNVELRGLDPTEDAAKIELYENKIQELSKEYEQVKNSMSKPLTSGQTAQLDAELEKTSMKLQEFEAKINDTRVSAEKSITLKINDDNWGATFSGLKGEITELKSKGSESVSALSDELKQLKATRDSLKDKTGDELISGFEKYEEQLQSLQTHIKTAKNELKGLASAASISRTSSSFETWLSKNTKALDHYGDEIDKVRQKLMEFKDVGATTAELNSVKTAIDNIKSTAAAEGNVGVSWIGKLGDQFKKLSTYVSAASVIYTGIRVLKDMVKQVRLIDTSLVELKKVTNETDDTYNQFLDNAKTKAVELGTTVSDLVNSTADFARLGYSIQDATTLAENASIFLRVADNMDSIDTATSVLVSTMKAYNIESSDSMSIIDKLNSVSNNYAVTTGGLGEALSKSASSFAAAGNTLDQSVALITAADEILNDDAAVGTAFKTNFCLYVQKCA